MDAPLSSDSSRKVFELYYSGNFYYYDEFYDLDCEEYAYGYTPYKTVIDTISYQSYISKEEEGRGVIYRMIDEYENDFPFDFKNIQFLYNPTTNTAEGDDAKYYYVFNYIDGDKIKWKDAWKYITQNSFTDRHECNRSKKTSYICGIIYLSTASRNRITVRISTPWVYSRYDRPSGLFFEKGGLLENQFVLYDLNQVMVVVNNWLYGTVIEQRVFKSALSGGRKIKIVGKISNCRLIFRGSCEFTCDGQLEDSRIEVNAAKCEIKANCSKSKLELERSFSVVDDNGNMKYLKYANIKCHQGNLTLKTNKTTGTSEALQHIEVDVCNSSTSGTITVDLDNIPLNTTYKTRIAQNSNGDIKMWCDADLVQ